jgi:hypothetical protein
MRRYDWFQIESGGQPMWLGTAESLEQAQDQIRQQPSTAQAREFQNRGPSHGQFLQDQEAGNPSAGRIAA